MVSPLFFLRFGARSDGKGSTVKISGSVPGVKVRPSVSRITGPRASLVRRHPPPESTAKTGIPPNRAASRLNAAKRAALSRAVPPSLAALHSRIARSVRGLL